MFLVHVFDARKATHIANWGWAKLAPKGVMGVGEDAYLEFVPFSPTMVRQWQGLTIDGDGSFWISLNGGAWLSARDVRLALMQHRGPVQLSLRIGVGAVLRTVCVGYWVDVNLVGYLLQVGIPHLLSKSWTLCRYLADGESFDGINDDRLVGTAQETPAGDLRLVSLKYSPLVVSTQNLYQGEEVPAIVIRPLKYANRKRMNESISVEAETGLLSSAQYTIDLQFEITIIASRTEDLIAGVDAVTEASRDPIEVPPIGCCFGMRLTSSPVFDQMDGEIEFGQLPSVAMDAMVFNVPIGVDAKEVEVLKG
jgi:hypothetical protein